MTDRVEEKRYQNAIQIRDKLNRKIDQARRTNVFAEKLSNIEKRPSSLPLPMKQETKQPPKLKERREESLEPKKQERKAKVTERPKQPRAKPTKEKNDSDQFFQFAAEFAPQTQKPSLELQPTPQPMLPSPVINELIERIYTCTASDGQKTVSIRLKGNILTGTQIDISVSDRDVKLRFQHTHPETRQLLRASRHVLQSRLAEKKLSLRDFAFH